MVSFPTNIMSNLYRGATSFCSPLSRSTRLFANTAIFSSTVVGVAAYAAKKYDKVTPERTQCADEALKAFQATDLAKTEAYSWFSYLFTAGYLTEYTQAHTFTAKERLENTKAVLERSLKPKTEDTQSQSSKVESKPLNFILGHIESKIKTIESATTPLTPAQEGDLLREIERELKLAQYHTEKYEKVGLLGALALGTVAATVRLGIPQAALRSLRVIS